MKRRRPLVFLFVAGLAVLAPAANGVAGVAMEGIDRATIQLPASVLATAYRNTGYSVDVRRGIATVTVKLVPLESHAPFDPPPEMGTTAVAVVARSVTAGAVSRYEAVSRILDWVARNIAYDLDRKAAQDADAVVERRSAYCTGVARLTVELLAAVGIEAREIPGFVADAGPTSTASGFHRWIEVFYPDRGWVFSDPLSTHHYVPASYVPLASEAMLPHPESDPGWLLERLDRREIVDLSPWSPPGVSARRNTERQLAGALKVTVEEASEGVAVLQGRSLRLTRELVDGSSTFTGVEPGTYTLRVLVEGRPPVEKRVVFRDRVRGAVFVPAPG